VKLQQKVKQPVQSVIKDCKLIIH